MHRPVTLYSLRQKFCVFVLTLKVQWWWLITCAPPGPGSCGCPSTLAAQFGPGGSASASQDHAACCLQPCFCSDGESWHESSTQRRSFPSAAEGAAQGRQLACQMIASFCISRRRSSPPPANCFLAQPRQLSCLAAHRCLPPQPSSCVLSVLKLLLNRPQQSSSARRLRDCRVYKPLLPRPTLLVSKSLSEAQKSPCVVLRILSYLLEVDECAAVRWLSERSGLGAEFAAGTTSSGRPAALCTQFDDTRGQAPAGKPDQLTRLVRRLAAADFAVPRTALRCW